MALTPKQFAESLIRKWKGTLYIPTVEHQIYSTEETVIGSYMGKPLYRKVVEVTVPAGANNNAVQVTIPLTGWDEVVKIGGVLKTDFGNYALPYTWVAGSAGGIDFWANKTTGICLYNSLTTGGTAEVYIEYTKISDTTSSPKVPYEPLHEWSTEEKLVGYWIDGSPVYEKTVLCGDMPNNAQKKVPHGINGLKRVVRCEATYSAGFIPYVVAAASLSKGQISIYWDATNIIFQTAEDRSGFNDVISTLCYTKTTD